MQPIDVCKVVDDVISFLGNHSDFKNVQVRSPGPCNGPLTVFGNEQELAQVIINLMINACHAVEKTGSIQVETGEIGQDQVLVTVKDNGTGIREKDFSRIFDPFFTTKPVGQGTGLGLSVGYGIIPARMEEISRRKTEKKKVPPSPSACPGKSGNGQTRTEEKI
ncbi:MAG: ATP-binding protein [Desulfotignum sp.]|nr:ATP-binding protein [Desulfotignum sp.]